MKLTTLSNLPHFFSYKMDFFPSKTIPKNLDLSYKMDLDLWDCLGWVKLILQQNCIGLSWTDLVICTHSREGKTLFYSRINMVNKL